MNKLTQKYLKECLSYDPEIGLFTWRQRPVSHFKEGRYNQRTTNIWNTKYKNKVAGYVGSDGYVSIGINGYLYRGHRLAFLYMEGYFPEHVIDHEDQNKSNNEWCNIRHVSQRCNAQNCKVSTANTSGVTGVSQIKTKKWHAQIKIDRKNKYLGVFDNIEHAIWARYNEEQNNPDWICSENSSAYKWLKHRGKI